jgi:hypothetical protein
MQIPGRLLGLAKMTTLTKAIAQETDGRRKAVF